MHMADNLGARMGSFDRLQKSLAAGQESGALASMISGSGPTTVHLARDSSHAVHLANELVGSGTCRDAFAVTGPVAGARVV